MGWAKRDELARLYRVGGRSRLYIKRDDGYLWDTAVPYRADDWTVRRGRSSGDDGYVQVIWNGHIQTTMGSWTTLCMASGTAQATAATDEQILHAYFCDQNVFDTGPALTMPQDGELVLVKTQCPVTYGGSAKRLSFTDLNGVDQRFVREALATRDLSVEECRGLHRI
jgi:hypothetical protein